MQSLSASLPPLRSEPRAFCAWIGLALESQEVAQNFPPNIRNTVRSDKQGTSVLSLGWLCFAQASGPISCQGMDLSAAARVAVRCTMDSSAAMRSRIMHEDGLALHREGHQRDPGPSGSGSCGMLAAELLLDMLDMIRS